MLRPAKREFTKPQTAASLAPKARRPSPLKAVATSQKTRNQTSTVKMPIAKPFTQAMEDRIVREAIVRPMEAVAVEAAEEEDIAEAAVEAVVAVAEAVAVVAIAETAKVANSH